MKIPLIFLAMFLFTLSGMAQNVKLEGAVKSEDGEALEMANLIVLAAEDSSMAAYGFTNVKGQFKIDVEANKNYILRISYMGFSTQDIVLKTGTTNIIKYIELKKLEAYLDEVQVVEEMPIMISGDTISYKADAFNTGTEKKLEDVLENLPGVEIDDNGEIKVEGKVVEKIMVEGKDFFDGDTKIATKNIPANAVDKVQILRNYNDVSPMGGVTDNDDRIAINIKLKEGKKNIFFGDIAAEAGPDSRYLLHPNLFYYSPKATYNFIGDINNIGQPAFTMRDYFRFSGGFRGMNSRSGSSLSVGNDLGIPLTQSNKTVDYTSSFGAFNFAYNPAKALTINGFLIGMQTNVNNKTVTLNDYVGQDSIANQEVLTTDGNNKDVSVLGKLSVKYTPNTKLHIAYDAFTKYSESDGLSNQFSDFGITTSKIENVNKQTPFSLNQSFEAFYDLGKKSVFSLEIQHLYKNQDPLFGLYTNAKPNFTIIPILDSSLIILNQRRTITTNKLDGILSYYYILNSRNHIEFTVGGSYSSQTLQSDLEQIYGDSTIYFNDSVLVNDVKFKLTDFYGGIHYKTRIAKLTLKMGANAHQYRTSDLQWETNLERDWNMILPDFYAKYNFKKSESLTFNYNVQAQFTDVNNAAAGVILKSYNSLFSGNQYLDNALFHSFRLTFFSFNMFNFTNIYAGLNYNHKINDITNAVAYIGTDRVNSPINSSAINDIFSGFGSYQRRIKFYKITFRANLSYGLTNNQINGVANQNISFNQNYTFEFSTNFKKAPNFDIGYKLGANNYEGTGVSTSYLNHQPYIGVEAPFFINFLFTAEYRYNFYDANNGPSSEYDFLDAALYYQLPSEKWEFKAAVTNLLNTEFIRQDSFGNSVSTTQQIFVLPRYFTLGVKYAL